MDRTAPGNPFFMNYHARKVQGSGQFEEVYCCPLDAIFLYNLHSLDMEFQYQVSCVCMAQYEMYLDERNEVILGFVKGCKSSSTQRPNCKHFHFGRVLTTQQSVTWKQLIWEGGSDVSHVCLFPSSCFLSNLLCAQWPILSTVIQYLQNSQFVFAVWQANVALILFCQQCHHSKLCPWGIISQQ